MIISNRKAAKMVKSGEARYITAVWVNGYNPDVYPTYIAMDNLLTGEAMHVVFNPRCKATKNYESFGK